MQIKTLTWNIGGGKLLKPGADPNLMSSYSVDGLDVITDMLKNENPDIITLQETQKNSLHDQVKDIADKLGYNFIHDSTSTSHIDKDYELGHAILTPHKIIKHSFGFFDNPNVQIEWENGQLIPTFDKGYTTCVLDINNQLVTVTNLHLVPFRMFGIDLNASAGKKILQNVETTISNDHSPWLIQGDFNINDDLLKDYLPKLFDDKTTEILLTEPTTPSDRKYDHIILRGGSILGYKVRSEVLTDHFPVIANISI